MVLFFDIPSAVFISFVFAKTEVQEHSWKKDPLFKHEKIKKSGFKDISVLIVGSLGSHLPIGYAVCVCQGVKGIVSYCLPPALHFRIVLTIEDVNEISM